MADILSSHWPCLYGKPLATALIPRAPSAQLSQDVRVTTSDLDAGCHLPCRVATALLNLLAVSLHVTQHVVWSPWMTH